MRWWVALIVFVVLGATFILVTQFGGPPNQGMDAATALAVIAGAAVAIERAIEGFWTLMAKWKSSWWPLSEVADQVAKIVTETETAVGSTLVEASAALQRAKDAGRISEEALTKANAEITELTSDFTSRVTSLKKLAPDNQRVRLIATTSLQAIAQVEKRYLADAPELERRLGIANQAITGLADFTASLTDNPGKRLWSLVIGTQIGLIIAGILTLDVFAASDTTPAAVASEQLELLGLNVTLPNGWVPFVGVALTGLIIGLGSNPTHEVIGFLKEAKKDRRAETQLTPDESPAVVVSSSSGPSRTRVPRIEAFQLTDDLVTAGLVADDQRSSIIEILEGSSQPEVTIVGSGRPRSLALRRR
jgi:hypothetical protein